MLTTALVRAESDALRPALWLLSYGAGVAPRGAHATARALELDRLIHAGMRLGTVSALAVNDVLSVNELKAALGT